MFEIGGSLREARLKRNLTPADVQKAIRIRDRYLQALEEERWELLPGDAYVKGFLRTYADYLGLDGNLYVEEYNSRLARPDEPQFVPARFGAAGRTRRRRRLPPPADRHRGHRRDRRGARGLAAQLLERWPERASHDDPHDDRFTPLHHTEEAAQDARLHVGAPERGVGRARPRATRGSGSAPAARTGRPSTRARSCRARRCP